MKIKNLKYVLGMLGLSTTLTFSGCGSNNSKVEELESAIESLQVENDSLKNELESLLSTDVVSDSSDKEDMEVSESEITTEFVEEQITTEEITEQKEEEKTVLSYREKSELIARIKDTLGLSFSYIDDYIWDQPTIRIRNITDDDLELSNEFYRDLNTILSSDDVSYKLELAYLGDEIDFSKLDLSNVNSLDLSICQDNFNYDAFFNYTYDSLTFYRIPFEDTKKILKNCVTSDSVIRYYDVFNLKGDATKLVEFLVESNLCISELHLASDNSIDEDTYKLFGKINTKKMYFNNYDLAKTKLDLDITLNYKIELISFSGYDCELGNIQIFSNNPDLYIRFCDARLTENTNFSVPNGTDVSISGNYTDIDAFYGLSNTDFFCYEDRDSNQQVACRNKDFYTTVEKILSFSENQIQASPEKVLIK